MDIERLIKLLRKNNIPDYYGIYIDCKGYSPTTFSYVYCDKENKNIILCDLPYTDYENLVLLKED